MMALSAFFSTATRCLLFSLIMTVLGFTWGCGGGTPSEVQLDDAAKARVQQAEDNMKKAFAKKKAAEPAAGKPGRKR